MTDRIDWQLTTHEGNRRRQHQQFRALSFREKLALIEQSGAVAEYFAARRAARGLPTRSSDAASQHVLDSGSDRAAGDQRHG
jgi:hypothetical protein